MESQDRGRVGRDGDREEVERFMIEPDGGRGFNGPGVESGDKARSRDVIRASVTCTRHSALGTRYSV